MAKKKSAPKSKKGVIEGENQADLSPNELKSLEESEKLVENAVPDCPNSYPCEIEKKEEIEENFQKSENKKGVNPQNILSDSEQKGGCDSTQNADYLVSFSAEKDNPDNWDEEDWEKLLNPAEFKCLPSITKYNTGKDKDRKGRVGRQGDYDTFNRNIPQRFQNYLTLNSFIKDYFSNCDHKKPKRPYTVPGLAHWLGFNSRRALLKFAQADSLCGRVVRSALLRIHAQRNEQLVSGQGQMTGRVADLKNNFGWNDMTPFSYEEKAYRESIERKKEEEGGGKKDNDSKHLHLHGMLPPEPQTMEEWSSMYNEYVKKKQAAEKGQATKKANKAAALSEEATALKKEEQTSKKEEPSFIDVESSE